MSETTARFALPLLAAGQAQKELDHNEAITLLEGLVQPVVQAVGVADPPATAGPGQAWIIGAGSSGAWSGRVAYVALWTEGGWRFAAPVEGMAAWSIADRLWARYEGGVWTVGAVTAAALEIGGDQVVGPRQPAVAEPAGGSVVDAEGRSAISAILGVLRLHGLTA